MKIYAQRLSLRGKIWKMWRDYTEQLH